MKTTSWVFFVTMLGLGHCPAQSIPMTDYYADTWTATDALGRQLPDIAECGSPKQNRTVGIFYFLWLGNHGNDGPYDITELLNQSPDNPQYGGTGAFHFWGKPELGYYRSDSDYVIITHARQLAAAGVDVLIFDVTNSFTYTKTYLTLCRLYEWIRSEGETTPQICFLTHSKSKETLIKLYDEFYAKNLYPELWFRWKGKPLMLTDMDTLEGLDPKIRNFFTLRHCWAWTSGKDTWNWLEHWPQKFGWHDSPDKPEQLSVATAQHPISNIGRSHYNNIQPSIDQFAMTSTAGQGLYFSQQIQRALQVGPEFAFITGWNEWVAQRFVKREKEGPEKMLGKSLKNGGTYFVDQYNQEYSRDIEPMEGGHADNYYYQMIAFIRRYKGVRPAPAASNPKTIAIDGRFDDWQDVGPEFLDSKLDCIKRNDAGFGFAGPYVNNTARNNFTLLKAASDDENIYFYAKTEKAITPHAGKNWMLLFIDTDPQTRTGWQGYDYRVNAEVVDDRTTTLQSACKDFHWQTQSRLEYACNGSELEIRIPRKLLNLTAKTFTLDFHWADNIQTENDILEFARSGDSAPDRRFNYRFVRK